MKNNYFWKIVEKFNRLMSKCVKGPDCTDQSICHGDCCSIKIDVPKVLAREYIKEGYATKSDFIRSNIFSFHLRFDEKTGKCFLFDKKINGCSVHKSGIKPPQCWIYPTNFSNPKGKRISCKSALGWKIIDQEKANKAERLLEKYVFLCKLEARTSRKNLLKRLRKNKKELIRKLKESPPSKLGGLRDGWDHFEPLSAQGISLQLKTFCKSRHKNCHYLEDAGFLNCPGICEEIATELFQFVEHHIDDYVEAEGIPVNGHYPFIHIFNFVREKNT
ncbi:MAG: YkgJ family cysteine cluster protein [Promethearchaeia archaeon]